MEIRKFLDRKTALRVLTIGCAILSASPSHAGYDANIAGVIADVSTYAGTNKPILFWLSNQPAHPTCTAGYFAIDGSIDPQSINRMYARLLAAHATGEALNIGYDSQGDCIGGAIHVWRVG